MSVTAPAKETQSSQESSRKLLAPTAENRPILWRAYSYLRAYWKRTAAAYGFAILITLLSLAIPQVIRLIVDRGIRAGNTNLLYWSVGGLLAITLIKGALTFLQGRWSEVISQSVAYDLRNAIHNKLSRLSFSYHDSAQTGQLLARAIQDVERIRFLTGRATLRLFQSSVLLLGTLVALLLMNPALAALALITMPVVGWVAFRLGSIYRPLALERQNQEAVLTTTIEQNLRGAQIVKSFAQEDAEIERFAAENSRWFTLSETMVRTTSINIPLIDFIASLSTVIVIWFGGRLVIQNQVTLGELVAFTTYLSQLINPVRRLGFIIPAVAQAASAGERIFEILDAKSEVVDAADAVDLPPVEGHVAFEGVGFSYFGRHQVLEDITFEATPGEVIALLGATGSGKSTVINLIPRFYEPTEGHILIDGYDTRDVTLQSLRDQIGIVLQETTLFATSISENIAFSCPDAAEQEIISAAKAARAHEFIMEQPEGYETLVGERGVTLSGGQKQRVAIARALLKDPRILILDDATSSVDTETERLIQQALERLMVGRTSFVIAQRLSTVRLADQIIVLEQGRIKARGTHQDLLRESGLYAEIYQQQLKR